MIPGTSEYVVGRLAPFHYVVAKFEGVEEPAAVYTVRQEGYKRWTCDCPAWATGTTRPCKHISMVLAAAARLGREAAERGKS